MAQRSLEQTEIMRAQLHAAFCPALDTNGKYGPNCAYFTIRNIGLGPTFNVTAQHISGVRLPLGNLEPGASTEFHFDNSVDIPQISAEPACKNRRNRLAWRYAVGLGGKSR